MPSLRAQAREDSLPLAPNRPVEVPMARLDPLRRAENTLIRREINYALELTPIAWARVLAARAALAQLQARSRGKASQEGEPSPLARA